MGGGGQVKFYPYKKKRGGGRTRGEGGGGLRAQEVLWVVFTWELQDLAIDQ